MPRPILDPNKRATINTTPRVNAIFCGNAVMIDTYDCSDVFFNEFMPRLHNECNRAQREHYTYTSYTPTGRPIITPLNEKKDLIYLMEPVYASNAASRNRKVLSLILPSGIISVEDIEEICDDVICYMCDIPEGYFKGMHMIFMSFIANIGSRKIFIATAPRYNQLLIWR